MMGLRERVLNNEECPWKSLLDLKRVRSECSRGTLGGEKGTGRKEGGQAEWDHSGIALHVIRSTTACLVYDGFIPFPTYVPHPISPLM